jgi:hypothetical protein
MRQGQLRRAALALCLCALVALAAAGTRRWSHYEHEMQDPVDDPPDAREERDWTFGRLRFRSPRDGGYYARWGIDANKSDRQFVQGLRRLTRVNARSIEEIVDVSSDDLYNWPWMFAVAAGDWNLTPDEAKRLGQYLERGGFLMVDDFHGESEWLVFERGIRQALPTARIVEFADSDAIFHTLYDLDERLQVPGANVVHGRGYERDGVVPHWRGVIDEQGRVVVAICFNMDVGDAWEFADDPDYPERFTSHAYRLGINYVLYSLTH